MVTVPAFVWRFGPILRGVLLGVAVGGFLGLLAWIDSGFLIIGLIAFVALFLFYGGFMARRMARHWPSAASLSGKDRERVAHAARRGLRIDDPRLVPALIDYRDGLHVAAENAKPLRWVIAVALVGSVFAAGYDAVFGSWGNLIVSIIYLVLLGFELFWWPKRQRRILANADRAVDMAKVSD